MSVDDPERFLRPAAPMECERVLPGCALSMAVLCGERGQLTGDLRVASEVECGLPSLLEYFETIDLEPLHLAADPVQILELTERSASPQVESLVEQPSGTLGIAGLSGESGLLAQRDEEFALDGRGRSIEPVSPGLRHDPLTGLGRQRVAKTRDVSPQGTGSGLRPIVVIPQILGQPVHVDDLSGTDGQQGEQAPLPRASDPMDLAVDEQVDAAEHANQCVVDPSCAHSPICPSIGTDNVDQ